MIKTYKKHTSVIPAKAGIHTNNQPSKFDFRWLWEIILERKILVFSVLFFLVTLPIFLLVTKYKSDVEAAWMDDAWGYRQTVAITNAGTAQTDFQVAITLNTSALVTAGKMQSDCDDIRVTDMNGKILPYWFSGCNTTTTKIWPKVPSLPTTGTTVYLYYGNPSAVAGKTKVGTQTYPGLSCKSILDAGDSTGIGNYWIDPTNGSTSDAFQAYCDQTNDSGGWMLVTQSMINNELNSSVIITKSSGTNNGLVYNVVPTSPFDCSSKYAKVYFNSVIPWTQIKTDYEFTGGNSCWGVFGNTAYGGDSNLVAYAAGTDTIRNQVKMGGSNGDNFDGISARCDNETTNFWHSNQGVATVRSAQVILRRNSMASVGGLGNGIACVAGAYYWKYSNIYIREASMEPANITVASPANEEKSAGPVAYWKFDEGYGTQTKDSTLNSNTGTFTGSTVSWQIEDKCVNGKCLYLDGNTGYIDAGNGGSINPTSEVTVSMWVKNQRVTNKNTFLVKKASGSGGYGIYLSQSDQIYFFVYWLSQSPPYQFCNSNYTLPQNEWVNITGQFKQDNYLKIYVNGVQKNSCSPSYSGAIGISGSNLLIGYQGWWGGGTDAYFKGYIDEVKVYPYARTAAQIKSDFASKGSGSVKGTSASLGSSVKNSDAFSNGLVGYWKSDEASGNGADSSGNSNTTTVSGSNNYGAGKFGNGFRSGVATTNLVTNPSLETGTAGGWTCWHNSGSGTCAQSSDTAAFGTKSWKSTMTVDGNQGNQTTSASVSGSTTYSVSTWVNITSWGGSNFTFYMREYYPTGNGQCGSAMYTASGVTNGWVRITGTCTTRADTTSLMVSYYLGSTSQVVYTDGVQIEQASSATPYVDGSLGTGYSWTGTAHGSTSTRTASNSSVANATSIQITNQITLSGWIKYDDNTGRQYILSKGASYVLEKTATQKFALSIYNGSSWTTSTGTTSVTKGTWYHVAATYDGSLLNVYVNGNLDNSQTGTGSIATTTNVLALGSDVDGTSYVADGILDDVRIYNRALSGKEVRDLYNWAPGPVGHWKMDEKTGTTAYDSSGNGFNSSSFTGSPIWKSGQYGGALDFTGTNKYVSIPAMTGKYSNMLTVSAWVYHTTSANWDDIVAGGCGDILFGFSNDLLNFGGQCNSPFGMLAYSTNINNGWHYVAGTYDGSMARLYVDGVQVNSIARSGSFTPGTLTISRTGEDFQGLIDDVRIYNYARTSGQIIEDMNAGHPLSGSPVGSQVGYWKFDEGYGVTVNNSGSGGSTTNGTLSGTTIPTWVNDGKFGKALDFNGTSSRVDSSSTDLRFPSGTFSMSLWVLPHTLSSAWRRGIIIGETYLTNGYRFGFDNGGKPRFWTSQSGGTLGGPVTTNAMTLNQWNYIAVTYDGATAKIYLNGKLEGTSTGTFVTGSYTTRVGYLVNEYFDGLIDEVKFYSAALTEDEIKLDYNRGSAMVLGTLSDTSGLTGGSVASSSASSAYCIPGDTTSCNPPIGEWNFEEKTGQSTYDTSGNNYTGILGSSGSPDSADPTWISGKIGGALKFDGSNDYVSTSTWGNFGSQIGSGTTLEAWVKTSNTSNGITTLIKSLNTVNTGWGIDFNRDKSYTSSPGKTHFFVRDDSGKELTAEITKNIYDGQWHHLTWVLNNPSTNSMNVYVDGASQTLSYGLVNSPTSFSNFQFNMFIGATNNRGTPASFSDSQIDGVKIFNYARTPAQIAYDYNRGAPVGHWKFDECQGITANDSSGNGNTGTVTIGATGTNTSAGTCTGSAGEAWKDGATGKYNASLEFDGTDDFINVGSYSNLNNVGDNISVSAWVKTSVGSGLHTIVGRGNDWRLNKSGNVYQFEHRNSSNVIVYPSGTNTSTDWVHVVGTYARDTFAKLYINGVLVDSDAQTLSTRVSQTQNQIGNNYAWHSGDLVYNDYWWDGQIDDVRIYNYALTANQVKTLYNAGAAVQFAPTTGSP